MVIAREILSVLPMVSRAHNDSFMLATTPQARYALQTVIKGC